MLKGKCFQSNSGATVTVDVEGMRYVFTPKQIKMGAAYEEEYPANSDCFSRIDIVGIGPAGMIKTPQPLAPEKETNNE